MISSDAYKPEDFCLRKSKFKQKRKLGFEHINQKWMRLSSDNEKIGNTVLYREEVVHVLEEDLENDFISETPTILHFNKGTGNRVLRWTINIMLGDVHRTHKIGISRVDEENYLGEGKLLLKQAEKSGKKKAASFWGINLLGDIFVNGIKVNENNVLREILWKRSWCEEITLNFKFDPILGELSLQTGNFMGDPLIDKIKEINLRPTVMAYPAGYQPITFQITNAFIQMETLKARARGVIHEIMIKNNPNSRILMGFDDGKDYHRPDKQSMEEVSDNHDITRYLKQNLPETRDTRYHNHMCCIQEDIEEQCLEGRAKEEIFKERCTLCNRYHMGRNKPEFIRSLNGFGNEVVYL